MKTIVLTGGPCAGKTTARNYLYEKLSDMGFSVIFMPEIPTLVINAGLDPRDPNKRFSRLEFQNFLLQLQIQSEEAFKKALKIKGGEKRIIIFDRGAMDFRAYTEPDEFKEILRRNNWNIVQLRDERYDAVFHLVTAAEGAPEFYNLNNPARLENPDQAKETDCKTKQAWLGHPHLRVIDNSTGFDDKMKRLLNEVRRTLGVPAAIETERKFLVTNAVTPDAIPVPMQIIEIEQFYIAGASVRFRRRSQGCHGTVYYRTEKLDTDSPLSRIETETQVTAREYYQALAQKNPETDIIQKLRACFLHQNQYFELDIFINPARLRWLTLLEIELTEENDKIEIPDWLLPVTEVTADPRYKNFELARALPRR
ncbi:MAG: AAA family ATPase [bacterium]|nr:AAA family ATPase [bacterium]